MSELGPDCITTSGLWHSTSVDQIVERKPGGVPFANRGWFIMVQCGYRRWNSQQGGLDLVLRITEGDAGHLDRSGTEC